MECDAIFRMNSDGSNVRMISSGKGSTTCSYISPDGSKVIYASTQGGGDDPVKDRPAARVGEPEGSHAEPHEQRRA